jgi:hypothetical protein
MRIAALFPLILISTIRAACAGSIEDDAYGAFEFFCIEKIHDISHFAELFPPIGFVEVSATQAQPFLSGRSGKVWMGKTQNTRLVIAETEEKACSLFAPDASASEVEKVFRKNAVFSELHNEKIGTEIEHMFAVSQRDSAGGADIHVMVLLKYSSLQTVNGIELTSMLASEFPDAEKNWPRLP